MKASPRESLWRMISAHPTADEEPPACDSPDDLLWPGTLWAHPATAAFAVEWLVVDRGKERPKEYLLMPADSHPILGIRDLPIPADEPCGPLSIRCHLGRWVCPSVLKDAKASGQIEPQHLERAIASFRASCRHPPADALVGRDGGPSPSYEDWIQDLELAWDALMSAREPPAEPSSAGKRSSAFEAFTLVILGFGAGSLFHLDKAPRSRSASWRRRFRNSKAQGASAHNSQSPGIGGLVLPQKGFIPPSQDSSDPGRHHEIDLPLGAEYLLLFFPLNFEPALPKYRLTLHDLTRSLAARRRQRVVLTQGALELGDSRDQGLYAIVARTALSPGTLYRIHVEGYRAPSWITVCRRVLRIRVTAAQAAEPNDY